VGSEWDESKSDANLHKHGIDFADAVTALEDEMALTIDALGRLAVVVYTWREDNIRLISARAAT
jgi:hypothetical protein